MIAHINDVNTRTNTFVGTVLTIFVNIQIEDLMQTIILAAVGAIVSFLVSIALKVLKNKFFH
jgi:ABC-type phosphate/phosphonate transport system permease subunit